MPNGHAGLPCAKRNGQQGLLLPSPVTNPQIEIIIKSIGHNFCFGPDAYLKSGWNWIDFLSTASGYLRYLPISENGGLSGIRAMRALRPLRALNAIPGK